MYAGKWPSMDPWGVHYPPDNVEGKRGGKDLAGGWRATLWVLKGEDMNGMTNLGVGRNLKSVYFQILFCFVIVNNFLRMYHVVFFPF